MMKKYAATIVAVLALVALGGYGFAAGGGNGQGAGAHQMQGNMQGMMMGGAHGMMGQGMHSQNNADLISRDAARKAAETFVKARLNDATVGEVEQTTHGMMGWGWTLYKADVKFSDGTREVLLVDATTGKPFALVSEEHYASMPCHGATNTTAKTSQWHCGNQYVTQTGGSNSSENWDLPDDINW